MTTSLFKALGLILLLSINLSTLATHLRKQDTLYTTKNFDTLYVTDIFVGKCPLHYKLLYKNTCVLYSTQPTECVENLFIIQEPEHLFGTANDVPKPKGYQATSGDFDDVLKGTGSSYVIRIFQKKSSNLDKCYKDLKVEIGRKGDALSSLNCPSNYDDFPGKIKINEKGSISSDTINVNSGVYPGTARELNIPARLCGTRTYPLSGVNDKENYVAFPRQIPSGTVISSKEGMFELAVQGDGNLQVYNSEGNYDNLWGSKTDGEGEGPYTLELQSDGNMVYYDSNRKVIWESKTGTDEKIGSKYSLVVTDNGEVMILDDTLATVWYRR